MKIAVSGATGSLGKAVMQHLTDQGHEVLGLGRNEAKIQALVVLSDDRIVEGIIQIF